MNEETIVAIYDTPAHAETAKADLLQAGVPGASISIHAGVAKTGPLAATQPREEGFWSSLFGGSPARDTAVDDHSVSSGGSVLSVKTSEARIDRVLEIIESHHPIDIDDRSVNYAQSPASAATAGVHDDQLIAPSSTAASPGRAAVADSEKLQLPKRS